MKTNPRLRNAAGILGLVLFVVGILVITPARLAAQSSGGVEFVAHVTPTDGRPEPVRQFTFYVLRKSLSDISQEAAQLEPAADLDKFVDSLKVSPKMKAWMKKNHTVQLSGADFVKSLTPEDIVDIPEFFAAYMSRNSGFEGIGFPKAKFKEKDRIADPEKYKQQTDEYNEAIRKFIAALPDSVQGIEADLSDINPQAKWNQILADRTRRLEKRTLDLAQSNYLVAQTDTDLDGHGYVSGLGPGDYWLGTLGTVAIAGDARLRWDLHVHLRAGEVARVELSNLNAAEPYVARRNSNE